MSEELTHQKGGVLEVKPAATMLEAIMREVSNPKTDPARLREFLEIGKDLEAYQAKKEYNAAYGEMMTLLPSIDKRGLIEYKAGSGKGSPYAKWDDIHEACMPILRKFGFAVSFDGEEANNKLTLVVIITHTSGHEERRRFTVPWQDTGGSKSPAQAAASARTLAQRHAFCAAFNILTRDKDDDGSGQGVPSQISEEHERRIEDLLQEISNHDPRMRAGFAKWLNLEFNVDSVAQLCEGHQVDAVFKKLSEKMRALGL